MDNEEHFNGSFSTPSSQDLNSELLNDHHLSTLLSPNHRLHHCTPQANQQEELMETLMKLPAIGLKLQISPSLMKQMQRRTQSKRKRINLEQDSERLKASTLGALMLQIGSWQVVARNEGDLVAKFYFAKRMLVWEILRNGLKEKVEIEWSNIIGIQAFMEENKRGILEVELHQPPKFYKEIEPEPRKHTQWTDGLDFTEGQAYINRRHCIVFPPRVLDKHYQKLKDKDERLFELSRRPFPTFNSPYFPSKAVFNQISPIQFEEIYVVNYASHLNENETHQYRRKELMNKVNTMRRYGVEASASYYNEGKVVNNEYDQCFYNANPKPSMVWLAQNSEHESPSSSKWPLF
ncbi:uncharacterized protein LOC111467893 [Cucurbita maxima]|uniref:Uncharacterized protein LOC111467893 n=1 Tax=Cucurbita maxima TaxID=3661 RepID=A0A6J1I0K3_CUCMA|nr:uncharacterized protein LOC111467893 [Cucurbita maxima]